MKFTLLFLTLTFTFSSYASYFHTVCRTPNNDIQVTFGQIQNETNITYYDAMFEEKVAKVSTWNLDLNFSNEYELKNETTHVCGFFSKTRIWAAQLVIKPSESAPNTLDFLTEESKELSTYVICEHNMNSMADCPEGQEE